MSIAALIKAVEAGTANMRDFIDAFGRIPMGNNIEAYNAYHGSLDAAKALHEALLPGCDWGRTEGNIYVKNPNVGSRSTKWGGPNEDPARAWLLAILRAKEAGQ